MIKRLLLLLSLLVFGFGFVSSTHAASEMNSYEVFWPMVAGKLPGESMYQLKILKENLRGALIFGAVQKSEYRVFIAAKRLLEAEKLLSLSKNEMALVSLNTCLSHLQAVKKDGISADAQLRLKNIKSLAKYLAVKYQNLVEINATLEKIAE